MSPPLQAAGGIAWIIKELSILKSNKAIKYRAYPTQSQLDKMWVNIHCRRTVYNLMLSDKIEYYDKHRKMLHNTPAQYKHDRPWLAEADASALCNAQQDLETAFKQFFSRPDVGFPKFRSRHRSKASYTTCIAGRKKNNIRFENGHIKLPKVGFVKIKMHRTAPADWKIKSATVEITPTGKVFISVLFEYENQVSEVAPDNILGLDYSSPYLYIDSNGNEPDFEKPFRKYQGQLAREQKKLSEMYRAAKAAGRDLSECRNYQKQRIKVARIHEKITNCRKDALHKSSHFLAENYDAVAVEDLNMKAMSQCLKLGKATLDNGYGMFVRMLEYKLAERGKRLIIIDKWYPSTKTCSCCGNTKPVRLNERTYVCPECSMAMDRDINAAVNIKNEALRMLAAEAA